MFDLLKITPVIQHLKQISFVFNNKRSEIEIFCPYCNDATRKTNPSHGHLYLSVDSPVFHCFRCSASGTLPKLLVDTGFNDEETIKYIASFIKYRHISSSYWKKRSVQSKNRIQLDIAKYHSDCIQNNAKLYDIYYKYMSERIGDVDFVKFLTFPNIIERSIACGFKNFEGNLITSRLITSSMRYQKHSDDFYFFQNLNDDYNRIVIAEGPFDIINSYLYLTQFAGSFFVSAMGTRYTGVIEYLVLRNMLIGEYELNIIFDNNLRNLKRLFWQARQIAKTYNENITINGFLPAAGKDVSDCLNLVKIE